MFLEWQLTVEVERGKCGFESLSIRSIVLLREDAHSPIDPIWRSHQIVLILPAELKVEWHMILHQVYHFSTIGEVNLEIAASTTRT